MQSIYSSTPYGTYGFYLGGATVLGPGCPYSPAFHTSAWVSQVKAQGWNLIPIFSDLQPSCIGITQNPIPTGHTNAFWAGVQTGQNAISAAYSRGMTGPLVLDIDRDVADSAACANDTDWYVRGFVEQVRTNAAYIAVLYTGSEAGSRVALRSLNLTPPSQIVIARYNGVEGVYSGIPQIPNSYWSQDQRGHQYSNSAQLVVSGVTHTIDLDCFDMVVFGSTSHSVYTPCLN
jgi:hypothetical protein